MKQFVYVFSLIDLYVGQDKYEQISMLTPNVEYLVEKVKSIIEIVSKKMKKKQKAMQRLKNDILPLVLLLNDPSNRTKYSAEHAISELESLFNKTFS